MRRDFPALLAMVALVLAACTSEVTDSAFVAHSSPPVPASPTAPASLPPSPSPSPVANVWYTAPDGSFGLRLSNRWHDDRGTDPTALYLVRYGLSWDGKTTLSIRMGDREGRVRTCDDPPTPYGIERCQVVLATSVEDLAKATLYQGMTELTTRLLDGEPAGSISARGYEYPARGSQSVLYVFAIHQGRPVVIRFWTGMESGIGDVDDVLAGFRFAD